MEHRFTIPEIKAFLREHALSFLGFELDPAIFEKFRKRYPDLALDDLDRWHQFEAANSRAFLQMYVFTVRKNQTGRQER
jgi:hypothetical protein